MQNMQNLKNIAKQWESITVTSLKANYNNFKIVDPQDVEVLSKIKIGEDKILIMANIKHENPRITLADLMKEIKDIKIDVDNIKSRLNHIDTRLDNLVAKNHLIE